MLKFTEVSRIRIKRWRLFKLDLLEAIHLFCFLFSLSFHLSFLFLSKCHYFETLLAFFASNKKGVLFCKLFLSSPLYACLKGVCIYICFASFQFDNCYIWRQISHRNFHKHIELVLHKAFFRHFISYFILFPSGKTLDTLSDSRKS